MVTKKNKNRRALKNGSSGDKEKKAPAILDLIFLALHWLATITAFLAVSVLVIFRISIASTWLGIEDVELVKIAANQGILLVFVVTLSLVFKHGEIKKLARFCKRWDTYNPLNSQIISAFVIAFLILILARSNIISRSIISEGFSSFVILLVSDLFFLTISAGLILQIFVSIFELTDGDPAPKNYMIPSIFMKNTLKEYWDKSKSPLVGINASDFRLIGLELNPETKRTKMEFGHKLAKAEVPSKKDQPEWYVITIETDFEDRVRKFQIRQLEDIGRLH